ncbi:hypothetical protein GTN31_07150 [Macrococcoides canis]|uniref:right-handed parallel beta-helix repeat-containing protein n=1 Tax=Macrococcoides canis TaxID=1855823 RepID=UPI0013E93B5D|nr:right-handed parallel beta-helix repeat-containing protein [Macrococcus canis]QIH76135.1 hypothetical protein GTN31_07150 [Macrococcus canis]
MDDKIIKKFYEIIRKEDLNSFIELIKEYPDILEYESALGNILYYISGNKRIDILKYIANTNGEKLHYIPENKDYNILTEAIMEEENEEVINYLIKNKVEVESKTISFALAFNQPYLIIEKLLANYQKRNFKDIRRIAIEKNRIDIVNLIDEKYLPKTPEAERQSSDVIIDFIDKSEETVLTLPDATYVLSHEVKRDIHIKGHQNTKLISENYEGIFQINNANVVLEQLILESTDKFLIPVINGKLTLKNCKLSIEAYGIYGENSKIELIDCEIIQEETKTEAHSVITIDRSELIVSNSKIEVEIALAQMKTGCKVFVENSEIRGKMEHVLFYTNNSMDIEVKDSTLLNAKAGIMVKDNSNISISDTIFRHFDRMIYCKDNNKIQIDNTEMKLAGSCIQIGRRCEVNVEDSQFSSADENHITIDQKSVIHVKRCSFDNANMAAISGLKGSEINVEDSKIRTTIAGIVTQGGKLNIERTKFIEIDEEGAVRGVKNDTIYLKDVIIDSSLTDIIVDKKRKLTQENVKITNPVTIDDL